MPTAAHREWTQIDLSSRPAPWGQRLTACLLVAAGVIGFVVGVPALSMWWWELLLLGLGCLVIVALGVALWVNASVRAGESVALVRAGAPTELPVDAAFETTDESVRFQLQLRLPEAAGEEHVVHSCDDPRCVAAGRAAPRAALPVLLDETRKTWGVVHDAPAS